MHHLLNDIGIALIGATVLGLLSHWLRQPIILGYLIAGALIGPEIGFGLVHDLESIEIISEIGLVLLLFIIGLEMNLKTLLKSGKQVVVVGVGQFPVCVLIGYGMSLLFGAQFGSDALVPLYLGLTCALSSTAIVVKLLYDKRELDTLPGRLTLGTLIFQDIYAIVVLSLQPNFADPSLMPALQALGSAVALLVFGFLVSYFILRWIFNSIAATPEMVVCVSLGWCTLVAVLAEAIGLSMEMGALVAGLSISAFPYSIHLTAKTLPLRDFFLTLFFVSLGMTISMPSLSLVGPVLAISALIVVSRFLSIYPLLALSGAGRRAAFICSINLAQLSEFSLVIASIGVDYQHIGKDTVAILIYVMAFLGVLSSYGIRYNHQLYLLFNRIMGEPKGRHSETSDEDGHAPHPQIALLGYHRGARALVDCILEKYPELLEKLVVIDFNPVVLKELKNKNVHAIFGDLGSIDTLHHAHLADTHVVISTIPDMLLKGTSNLALVRAMKTLAPNAKIIATADDLAHETQLRNEGAHEVLQPFTLLGERIAGIIADSGAATS